MMVIDSSVLIAIITREPEQDEIVAVLEAADHVAISASTLVEVRMVAHNKGGPAMVGRLDALLNAFGVEVVATTAGHADIAHAAFVQYGKGSGHPARLNFGDLFAYALSKSRDIPLLFKGNDFSQTDVKRVD